MLQMEDVEFIANSRQRMRNSFSSTKVHLFLCFVGVFEADWEAILLAWVTRQQNDDVVVVVAHVTGMRIIVHVLYRARNHLYEEVHVLFKTQTK